MFSDNATLLKGMDDKEYITSRYKSPSKSPLPCQYSCNNMTDPSKGEEEDNTSRVWNRESEGTEECLTVEEGLKWTEQQG